MKSKSQHVFFGLNREMSWLEQWNEMHNDSNIDSFQNRLVVSVLEPIATSQMTVHCNLCHHYKYGTFWATGTHFRPQIQGFFRTLCLSFKFSRAPHGVYCPSRMTSFCWNWLLELTWPSLTWQLLQVLTATAQWPSVQKTEKKTHEATWHPKGMTNTTFK